MLVEEPKQFGSEVQHPERDEHDVPPQPAAAQTPEVYTPLEQSNPLEQAYPVEPGVPLQTLLLLKVLPEVQYGYVALQSALSLHP